MRVRFFVPVLILFADAAVAQQPAPAAPADGMMATIRAMYDRVKDNITQAAAMTPAHDYHYRPVADVRTFGELIGHIANGNFAFCAAARGEDNPNKMNIERTVKDKDDLVEALARSFAWCDPAYAISAADAAQPAFLMGSQRMRFDALVINSSHDDRHYGNIVTYMRLRGLVPPTTPRPDTTRTGTRL